ncbi:MAG: NAD-dependent DNA ligase LigA, partial [Oscillospiraceae bacterium]|nr:NAD-dependent DNA ligase LigA [Oscillospiraceae bacterium]
PLWRLIFCIGIRGVGQSIAKLICNNYSDIFKLMDATKDELSVIEGIGPIIGSNIENYFSLDETKEIVHRLSSLGLNMKSPVNENIKDNLLNLTFVITGKLKNKKRDEMKQLIENHGGKVSSSVSSKTNYLIAGEDAGSKLDKAISLGIEVIDEKKALDMIDNIK